MQYKITNTTLDPTKTLLHRRASKMQMEPTLAGRRLRLRSSMVLNEAQMRTNEEYLLLLVKQGTVSVTPIIKLSELARCTPQEAVAICEVQEEAPQILPALVEEPQVESPLPLPPAADPIKVPEINGPPKLMLEKTQQKTPLPKKKY